jgi:HPt (histidine-containing phosphotransfer) domain-containing protein
VTIRPEDEISRRVVKRRGKILERITARDGPVVGLRTNLRSGAMNPLMVEAPLRIFDPEELLARVAGDRECMREIVKVFLLEYPGWLAEARAAVAAGDAEQTRQVGHRLAGTLANFGADWATAAARRLEQLGKARQMAGAEEAMAELERTVGQLVPLLRDEAA